jgi:hypothetical protein
MEWVPLYGQEDFPAPALGLELLEPLDSVEACPITLMPIADSPPVLNRFHKGRLPCGHGFAAVPLLRHFAQNRMRCPICRAGVDRRLDVARSPLPLEYAPPREEEEAAITTTVYAIRILGEVRLIEVQSRAPMEPFDALLLLLYTLVTHAEEEEEAESVT